MMQLFEERYTIHIIGENMEKHHKTRLKLLIEELADTGIVEVNYRELYRIFHTSRITVTVWRQILEVMAEDIDEDEDILAQEITVCEPNLKASYFLVYSKGLHQDTNKDIPPIRPLADLI